MAESTLIETTDQSVRNPTLNERCLLTRWTRKVVLALLPARGMQDGRCASQGAAAPRQDLFGDLDRR
jgi:hypothetical protein